jgi:hypothetical protein
MNEHRDPILEAWSDFMFQMSRVIERLLVPPLKGLNWLLERLNKLLGGRKR